MNVELKYKGDSYKFDLPKDATLNYIKNLESSIVNEDISNFNLFYKNSLISNYPETTPLSDLSKNDKNISIIILPKNRVLPIYNKKLKISQLKEIGNSQNVNSLKALLNARGLSPIKSEYRDSISKRKNFLDYLSEFRVFKQTYNLKENLIFSLMKSLSLKIQEYNDNLFKKIKKNKLASELVLFERNVIEYQDKQINYLKKLINYFEDKEKEFIEGAIPLFDFYKELSKFDDKKDFRNNNNNNNIPTENNIDKELNKNNINDSISNNNNNMNLNTKGRLSNISMKKFVKNEKEENSLPFLNNNKPIEKKSLVTENNQNNDLIPEKEESNEEEEENNKVAKNEIFNINTKVKKSRNTIKFPNTTIKKEKRIYKTVDNYKNKNNEENIYNKINISNIKDKINQYSISQKKIPKSIVIYITEKNEMKENEKDSKDLNKEYEKEKDEEKDKDKEEDEEKDKDKEKDSDEEKDQRKKRNSIFMNNRKLGNKNDINNYIFQRSKQDRRYKTRKRIGKNENDFII